MKRNTVKRLSLALSAMLLLTMLSACGGGKAGAGTADADKSNTLVYGAEFMDEQFNPIMDTSTCGTMLFRGLMTTDENCQTQCDIATDYKISDDLLTYTFNIRPDVKFHDGSTLTADDVVFTIKSVMDEKVNSALREDFALVDTVEKTSDTSLVITLKEPFPALLDKLTIGIVPAHCFEGKDINTADFNTNPIGCGPYKFVSLDVGSKVTLTRFDDYYGNKAKIKNIVYLYLPDYNTRALQLSTGEIDLAYVEPSQASQLDAGENTTVYKIPTADYRCVMFNFDVTHIFDDVNVRQAICYATDRDAVVNSIVHGFGEAAYSPLQLNKYLNKDVEKYSYDTEKAQSLLDKAGWKDSDGDGVRDKNGTKLAFTLTAPVDDEVRVNIANYLASEWKKIGIDCKVDALGWDAIDITKCEAFVLGWGSPFDADNDTYRLFTTDASANYGSYSDSAVDSALTKARITADDAARGAAYGEFQTALAADPAYDFICYLTALYGANTRVSGINVNKTLGHHGAGVFWNVEDWELK